jgi:hypothetical protein
MEREPRLLAHMLSLATQGARDDIALIRRREGLGDDDLRAPALVHLIGTVARLSTEEYFSGASTTAFPQIFLRQLAAFRDILN